MIQFEDHSEENRMALLAYLALQVRHHHRTRAVWRLLIVLLDCGNPFARYGRQRVGVTSDDADLLLAVVTVHHQRLRNAQAACGP